MNKLIIPLFASAVLLSAGSCIRNTTTCPKRDDESDARLNLRLRTPDGFASSGTRALTFAQENTIEDIYVLVFNKAGSLVAIKQGQNLVNPTPDVDDTDEIYSGTAGTFTVTLEASDNNSDTYNLVVLANSAALLANTIGTDETSASIGSSYATVIAAVYGIITAKMYNAAGDDAIPMWGESGALVVQPGNNNKTIDMMRAVARIDIGVGAASKDKNTWSWNGRDAQNAAIPFTLGHIYVMRPNKRYAVVPNPDAASGAPTVPASTESFDVAASKANFGYAATNGVVTQEIYVPEADIMMGATGTSGDANHTKRMAIVVGGYYNGSSTETFYRLDFAVNKLLVNVLRNHLYVFAISKVTGPGYSDVETAYNSLAMNMTVNIYDWNAVDMSGIFLDGTHYVMIGRSANAPNDDRTAVLFRAAGSQDKIEMRTNIPPEEFTMTLSNGGALLDSNNPAVIENGRFNVELDYDGTTDYFVFTSLLPYDDAAADNPSVLTVTSGRITFSFTIRQMDNDPTDWIDGGNFEMDF